MNQFKQETKTKYPPYLTSPAPLLDTSMPKISRLTLAQVASTATLPETHSYMPSQQVNQVFQPTSFQVLGPISSATAAAPRGFSSR